MEASLITRRQSVIILLTSDFAAFLFYKIRQETMGLGGKPAF